MADGSNKRKYKRLPSSMSACVRKVKVSPHDLDEIRLVIKNISMGGVFIETMVPFDIDTVLRVSFALPGSDREVQALGIVRWVSNTRDMRGMGVQFLKVTTEDKDAIKEHVAEIEAKRRKEGKGSPDKSEKKKDDSSNKPKKDKDEDEDGGLSSWH